MQFAQDINYDNLTSPSQVFNDSENVTNSGNIFILPVWRQFMWSILYTAMVFISTAGNLIVIWIVLSNKQMRTVTNYFLVNLSVADAMVSTLNVTFNFIYMLFSHWPFGEIYCKLTQFIAIISVWASVFSLMSIAIERYIAIMKPLKPRLSQKITLLLVICIWILGVIFGSPSLIFYKTHFVPEQERIICYGVWPDGASNESQLEYAYNISFLLLAYVVPISSMSYIYAKIGIELWGSESIGESTLRQLENKRSKKRVVKMMVMVVIMFAVCWLPYHSYFIILSYYPQLALSYYIQDTYLAIYWLAMSNSMYNPMIYCWMNIRFRNAFKRVFTCLPCIDKIYEPSIRQGTLKESTRCTYVQSDRQTKERIQ